MHTLFANAQVGWEIAHMEMHMRAFERNEEILHFSNVTTILVTHKDAYIIIRLHTQKFLVYAKTFEKDIFLASSIAHAKILISQHETMSA